MLKTVIKNFIRKLVCFKFILWNYLHKQNKTAIIVDTPIHGNLGDNAIVLAQKEFISNYYENIFEITAECIDKNETTFAKHAKKNQLICIPGGGFMGYLWPEEEFRVQRIINEFHDQKIVIFPQTITFDLSSKEGYDFFERAYSVYKKHKNLTIFVREQNSFDFMKTHMPEINCKLVPDIVTTLKYENNHKDRNGVLFCMRSDKEKRITNEEMDDVMDLLKKYNLDNNISYTDTVINKRIFKVFRNKYVVKKLDQISQSKLLITDRLHGMIFSAITCTPCIAFGNSNGKVKGVYEWLKKLSYIFYVDSIDEVDNLLANMKLDNNYEYTFDYEEKFSDLAKEIM